MKINDSLTVQTCKNKKKPDDRVRRPGLLPETLPQTLAAVAALVSMVNVGGPGMMAAYGYSTVELWRLLSGIQKAIETGDTSLI